MKIVPTKTFILSLVIILSLSGCAVLTDSQVKNINAFAAAAKSYSAFPSAVARQRAEFHLHSEITVVSQSQFADADDIARRMDSARKSYNNMIQLSEKFDLSLQLLQQYAGLLTRLSSDHYITDLNAPTTSLGENLSSLVATYNKKVKDTLPSSLGTSISKIILMAGRVLTRHRQTSALKEFVLAADTLVQVTARNLVSVLDGETFTDAAGRPLPSLKTLLSLEKEFFIQSYKRSVLSDSSRTSYWSIKFYYDELTAYDNTEALRQGVVQAAKSLALAHAELAKNVKQKKELKDIIGQTQQLITDVQTAGSAFSSLSGLIKLP
ncbi:MAG: hypothetical protein J0H74_14765 [Chitinophagaceae bacterium]|nr:hypothetical protein [Chitinophagaceae bacterium]